MTIWFTADTHFGHENVMQYCQRPFSSVSKMDEQLTDNWNRAVKSDDTIYHLGDFTLLGMEPAEGYFQQLNGKIQVIPGGHDHRWIGKGTFHSKPGHPVIIMPPLLTMKAPSPILINLN